MKITPQAANLLGSLFIVCEVRGFGSRGLSAFGMLSGITTLTEAVCGLLSSP